MTRVRPRQPGHVPGASVRQGQAPAAQDQDGVLGQQRRRQGRPPQFTQFVPNLPFTHGRVQATGLYLQDDMRFGKLNVLAGLRYDRVKGSATSMTNRSVTRGLDRSDGATSDAYMSPQRSVTCAPANCAASRVFGASPLLASRHDCTRSATSTSVRGFGGFAN